MSINIGERLVGTPISVRIPFVVAAISAYHSNDAVQLFTTSVVGTSTFVGLIAANVGEVIVDAKSSTDDRFTACINIVHELMAWRALGIQSRRGVVPVRQEVLLGTRSSGTLVVGASGSIVTWFQASEKIRVPYEAPIMGVKIHFAIPGAIAQWNLFIAHRQADGVTFDILNRSEDVTTVPAVATDVYFNKHMIAHAGDFYGIEVKSLTSNAAAIASLAVTPALTSHPIAFKDGAMAPSFTLTGGGVFVFDVNTILDLSLLMPPPAIAIAGHSIMAGATASSSLYEDTALAYVAEGDPAYWVSQVLNVPCVNIAMGGTAINNWINPTDGQRMSIAEQLLPSVLVYDSHYNEATAYAGGHKAWLENYDILLSICDTSLIELVLAEGYVPGATHDLSVLTDPTCEFNQSLIYSLHAWAALRGILWVPQNYRIGQNDSIVSAGATRTETEDKGQRWTIKNNSVPSHSPYGSQWPNYRGEASNIHLNIAGQKAQAQAIAQRLRNRGGLDAMAALLYLNNQISQHQMPVNTLATGDSTA